jgi:hypothetical protein
MVSLVVVVGLAEFSAFMGIIPEAGEWFILKRNAWNIVAWDFVL